MNGEWVERGTGEAEPEDQANDRVHDPKMTHAYWPYVYLFAVGMDP